MDSNSNELVDKKGLFYFYEKYMIVMGVAGQALFYFQGYTICVNKSAQDVSLTGFIFSLISVASWMLYGIFIKNRVIVIANVVATIGAAFVVAGILLYQTS